MFFISLLISNFIFCIPQERFSNFTIDFADGRKTIKLDNYENELISAELNKKMYNVQVINLQKVQSKTFDSFREHLCYAFSSPLTSEQIIEFITLMNLFVHSEKLTDEKFNGLFNASRSFFNTLEKNKDLNIKFNIEDTDYLKNYHKTIITIFEISVKSHKEDNDCRLIHQNNQIRLYDKFQNNNLELDVIRIFDADKYEKDHSDYYIVNALFSYCRLFNIKNIFIYDKYNRLEVLIKKDDNQNLVDALNELKKEKFKTLEFYNFLENGDDLKMLSDLKFNQLRIFDESGLHIKTSDFEISDLESIILYNVIISMDEIRRNPLFSNLKHLKFNNSIILDGESTDRNLSTNIKSLYIISTELDKSFFDWYENINNLKTLIFSNNIYTDDKLKKRSFSKKQIRSILEKNPSIDSIIHNDNHSIYLGRYSEYFNKENQNFIQYYNLEDMDLTKN